MKPTWFPMIILVAFALVSCGNATGTYSTAAPANEPAATAAFKRGVTATAVPTKAPTIEPEPVEVATSTSVPVRVREDRGINPRRDITIQ